MKNKTILTDILISIILTLFIFSASVVLSLNFRPLYYLDIQLLHISESSGFAPDEIKENYDVLIDYNQFFHSEELVFPTLTMSDSGRIHFEEVKVIFVFFQYLAITMLILTVPASIFMYKKGQYKGLKLASILTIVIPIILGILVVFNWKTFFVTFHELMFDNDYWIFDAATDPVITILPDAFFMHAALLILLLIIAGSLFCHFLYRKSISEK